MSGELPLRRRVARLGWISAALFGLTAILVLLAVWLAFGAGPTDAVGRLPVAARAVFPSFPLVFAAIFGVAATLVVLAALDAAASMRVLARDRRIPDPLSPEMEELRGALLSPLGPSTVRLVDEHELPEDKLGEGGAPPPLRLTVLIPAHDEELTIQGTLESLRAQTRQPDRIIVVADNCTDDTAEIARGRGADVFTTVGNTEKKAGALNQALSEVFGDFDR